MDNINSISILGVRVDKVNMKEALSIFTEFLNGNSCKVIFTPNPEIIYQAQRNKELANILNLSDLSLPDGMAVVKASEMMGNPLEERVTGIDFSRAAVDICAERGKSIFLLGAKPGVAKMAANKLYQENHKIQIAGTCDGYFNGQGEGDVVSMINDSKADFLLVALGSPKQEEFIIKHKDELKLKAAVGIGGSFDVWSGNIKRAPKIFIDLNLEWLFRLIIEPQRIKRVIKIPKFLHEVKIRYTSK